MTWARQLLSSFTVSPSPWRSLSTNAQKLFLAHLPSTSPRPEPRRPEQERKGAESRRREGPVPAPGAPNLPQPPGNNFMSPSFAQQPGQSPRAEEKVGTGAWWLGRSMAQCAPSGSGLRWGAAVRRPAAGRSCSFPSGWDPTGFCMSQKPGHKGRWLLSQTGPLASRLL